MSRKRIQSLLVVLIISALTGGLISSCTPREEKVEYIPLMKERVAYETKLVYQAKAPQPYDNRVPPGAQSVVYQSKKRDMKGWLFKPMIEGKRPAVLYCHSGYAIDKYDAQAIAPLVNAGYVVFVPAFRAENGNPGSFEMCYGEVVDAVNALNWLGNRPEVDSSEIYGAGNGVGATIVWLLAEISPKLKKVVAFGPNPSMLRSKKTYPEPPFNVEMKQELRLRSPGEFVQDLKCPILLLFVSGDKQDEDYLSQAKTIIEENEGKLKEDIKVAELVGADHKKRTGPAIGRMVNYFAN